MREDFPFPVGRVLPVFGLELLYNVLALGCRGLGACGCGEVAFVGRRSCEPLEWRQFDGVSRDTVSKMGCAALLQGWVGPSLRSSSAICDCLGVQWLDGIFEIRRWGANKAAKCG